MYRTSIQADIDRLDSNWGHSSSIWSYVFARRKRVRGTSRRSFARLVSALLVLVIVLAWAAEAIPGHLQVYGYDPGATPSNVLWSCDFESGRHDTYFNYANDKDLGVGNNPGQVVTALTRSGNYAGYYYYTSPNTGSSGVTRDFWSIDWTGNQPKTKDFTVEGWFYVPSVTITSWVSFISIHFNGYSTISVDYNPAVYGSNRFLYLYNQMTANWGFQSSGKEVQFPFDRWFKLAVEVHYRLPNSQPSEFMLYQDDVKIIDQVEAVRYNDPTNLLALHFGVYNDDGQKQFALYNDDLQLLDQSVQLAIWANDRVSHTRISGASVYVDGSVAGTTDLAGGLIIQVPAGVHELTVRKDGYGDAVTRINMISKVNFIVFLTRTT